MIISPFRDFLMLGTMYLLSHLKYELHNLSQIMYQYIIYRLLIKVKINHGKYEYSGQIAIAFQ